MVQESADSSCQRQTYMLHSPRTGQVLIGSILQLEPNGKQLPARIADVATAALKEPAVAPVAPFPLPDGIHAVSIMKQTKGTDGFTCHAFVDASNTYHIVGTRGNLVQNHGMSRI